MIIKVELVIEWTDKAELEYENAQNKAQILLNEIHSNLEFDRLFIVKSAEAYETNHVASQPANDVM